MAGIVVIAKLGFVEGPYSAEKQADPFWISVGFGLALQSLFFSAFSLLCVMTWENTQQLKRLLSASSSEDSGKAVK
ncbi:hypothetical protein KUV44_12260 [Marinobacter daepoensis]|uniref:Uncharacterized protein n=1 Tax=Marinobacter daepoensis TaxID=262077 RepID=A0ABS3BGN5_9GAMM|nr:hypothetical protein [Marinobacter daepoensis]MBN7770470.1 hypothetical protein [Marinobacter daepoensis]MBY6079916.1 hypothetical protein [Marinobacter daepoensis]